MQECLSMSGDTNLVIRPTRCNVDWQLAGSISCFFDFELRFLCAPNTDPILHQGLISGYLII